MAMKIYVSFKKYFGIDTCLHLSVVYVVFFQSLQILFFIFIPTRDCIKNIP